ncbi:hypothetical protein Hanom_Chr15g01385661 [Helianthus anomalus]
MNGIFSRNLAINPHKHFNIYHKSHTQNLTQHQPKSAASSPEPQLNTVEMAVQICKSTLWRWPLRWSQHLDRERERERCDVGMLAVQICKGVSGGLEREMIQNSYGGYGGLEKDMVQIFKLATVVARFVGGGGACCRCGVGAGMVMLVVILW